MRSSASKSSSLIRPLGLIRNGVASTRRPAAVSLSTVAATSARSSPKVCARSVVITRPLSRTACSTVNSLMN
ncbi:Uncharacterised protein [Mycobacterium tuberculosis]|nr:Uncharacterised protein [Mycobacterium tuberculosis]